MKTSGSHKVTPGSFNRVRFMQDRGDSVSAIRVATSHSATTQKDIKRAHSWARWQEIKAAKRFKVKARSAATEVHRKVAARKAEQLEKGTNRVAPRAVAKATIGSRISLLETMVQAQGKELIAIRKLLVTYQESLEQCHKEIKDAFAPDLKLEVDESTDDDDIMWPYDLPLPIKESRPWWKFWERS